jgi:hypothetical protein
MRRTLYNFMLYTKAQPNKARLAIKGARTLFLTTGMVAVSVHCSAVTWNRLCWGGSEVLSGASA